MDAKKKEFLFMNDEKNIAEIILTYIKGDENARNELLESNN